MAAFYTAAYSAGTLNRGIPKFLLTPQNESNESQAHYATLPMVAAPKDTQLSTFRCNAGKKRPTLMEDCPIAPILTLAPKHCIHIHCVHEGDLTSCYSKNRLQNVVLVLTPHVSAYQATRLPIRVKICHNVVWPLHTRTDTQTRLCAHWREAETIACKSNGHYACSW